MFKWVNAMEESKVHYSKLQKVKEINVANNKFYLSGNTKLLKMITQLCELNISQFKKSLNDHPLSKILKLDRVYEELKYLETPYSINI